MPPEDELERLYNAHAPHLYAFALHLTGNEAETRDLLQDLFVKLAKQPKLMDGVRDPRSFLLRLLHHGAIDQHRRRQVKTAGLERFSQEAAAFLAPSNEPEEQEFRIAAERALAELPEEQQVVVHLKLWAGLTFEAISEMLGISLNTAASRYRYGLDKLRRRLRPLYEELR